MHEDADIAEAVAKLGEIVDPDAIMLIGARCRDIHQRSFRTSTPARVTNDIDFALAISSWSSFIELSERFPSRRNAWQRLNIGGDGN